MKYFLLFRIVYLCRSAENVYGIWSRLRVSVFVVDVAFKRNVIISLQKFFIVAAIVGHSHFYCSVLHWNTLAIATQPLCASAPVSCIHQFWPIVSTFIYTYTSIQFMIIISLIIIYTFSFLL